MTLQGSNQLACSKLQWLPPLLDRPLAADVHSLEAMNSLELSGLAAVAMLAGVIAPGSLQILT